MGKSLRIVLEFNVPESVRSQIKRTGFSVQREGKSLAVRVPNQVLPADSVKVKVEEQDVEG